MRKWTPEEDKKLQGEYWHLTAVDAATLLYRTPSSIESRRKRYNSDNPLTYQWEQHEIDLMRKYARMYDPVPVSIIDEVAALLPTRTHKEIADKYNRMGISIYTPSRIKAKNKGKKATPTTINGEFNGNPYYKAAKLLGGSYNLDGTITKNGMPICASKVLAALKQVIAESKTSQSPS
jgi:hypothetical protein